MKNDKPPWAGDQRQQQQMTAWVLRKLDEADLRKLDEANAATDALEWDVVERWYRQLTIPSGGVASFMKRIAIAAAECGNMEPLRRLLPEYARYIHPPKSKGRGHKLSKPRKKITDVDRDVAAAALDVWRIRDLWEKAEYGKKNRKGLQPTAEQIAAAALDVRRIRDIWQEPEPTGYGKKNRKGLQPTAEQIAAQRWDVTVNQVNNALRHLPGKRGT